MQTADGRVLIDRVLAMRNAVDHKSIVMRKSATIGAGVFAVGPLVMDPAFRCNNPSFNHDLGVSRDGEIGRESLHELGRLAIEAAQDLPVVAVGVAHHGGDMVKRRAADQHGDRHVLAFVGIVLCRDAGAMSGVPHVDVGLVLRPVHEAIDSLIDETVLRVAADHVGVVQVGIAVFRVMLEKRKHGPGQRHRPCRPPPGKGRCQP